tara:strand:+ start:1424 stop:1648 length:225 start_codon:yes stop_codon:yes gene_type:complete
MKIYITLEDGKKRYYANKQVAKRNAKKSLKYYEENGDSDHSCDVVEVEDVPTNKKGLIEWLNENAYYTGFISSE